MILGKHTVFPYKNAIHEKVDSVFCVIFRTLIRSEERHVVYREMHQRFPGYRFCAHIQIYVEK